MINHLQTFAITFSPTFLHVQISGDSGVLRMTFAGHIFGLISEILLNCMVLLIVEALTLTLGIVK